MAIKMGAAAGAAAVSGAGLGLFSYNRANYQFDAKMRYTQFTASMNMAIAQTGIYKQDIQQMSMLTVTRQDAYHVIAAMGLTILTAIYCPGRVGLHTPPPPGWLMGLAFVNIAGCYLFFGLTIWLAMHASMRADTAATHMLTRHIRLPIPAQATLDRARKFLSSFEEQPLKEAFRIPFTRHQRASPYNDGGYNQDMGIEKEAKSRTRSDFDVPAWYRVEKASDKKVVDSIKPVSGQGAAPEHFECYREIQMEWFPYDVYARLSVFLAFMHLTFCWAYLQIGHHLTEIRSLWSCFTVLLQIFVLQQVIMTLDINPTSFPFHRLGPFALFVAYVAAAMEYSRWYSPATQAICFVLVYVAHAIHIIFILQMYWLCRPSDEPPVVADVSGSSWWPSEWKLPTAFQHSVWLVAPPRELEQGQNDIVGEMRAAQGAGYAAGSPSDPTDVEQRKDVHTSLGAQGESPAWFNVKVGLISLLVAWVWMTFGFTIEIINQGTVHPSLLSPHGVPNNARDPRYRPAKPGMHEPTEVGTGGIEHGPAVGIEMGKMHRRLSEFADFDMPEAARKNVADRVRELLPHLQAIARAPSALETTDTTTRSLPRGSVSSSSSQKIQVRWPALFQPELLASSPLASELAAISRHGRGTIVNIGEEVPTTSDVFVLDGVARHGPISAVQWDKSGLVVVTSAGVTLECAGANPQNGKWKCSPISEEALLHLPAGSAASISRKSSGDFRAAVAFPGENSMSFFDFRRGGNSWLPAGEARTNYGVTAAAFDFSQAESLLLAGSHENRVSRLNMGTGGVSEVAPALDGTLGLSGLYDGRIARLVLANPAGAAPAMPELLVH